MSPFQFFGKEGKNLEILTPTLVANPFDMVGYPGKVHIGLTVSQVSLHGNGRFSNHAKLSCVDDITEHT